MLVSYLGSHLILEMTEMHKLSLTTTACLVAMLCAQSAWAQGSAAITGDWVATDVDAGEVYYAEFSSDGRITIDIYNVQFGLYVLDDQQRRLTIIEDEAERESIDDDSWVKIRIQGDKLTMTAQDDQRVVLDRISRPEKADSSLVGRWLVNGKESTPEIVGENREVRMFMTFNIDGSASYEELEETLKGLYKIDPAQGTIEFTINDEVEAGTYKIEDNQLTIHFADETHVFQRAD